ncbi:MAG: bifunctional serine/threonine-protein kinase/formylglycine-generating enzyme family protein [Planctomycetota bacterium]
MDELTPAETEQLRALYERFVDLPQGQLAGALDREALPPRLRRELESLLRQSLHTVFGERALGNVGRDLIEERLRDQRPEAVGPYRVLRILGEGGMGEVYLAEQTEPVQRQVALKVIKLGMNSREILARFEQERQTLAMLDHDAIAKIHDAGMGERGQPYFVMEYVDGQPITGFCDAQELDVEARVRLITAVCEGVQHAHSKGVIHRDLKPSNVLVFGDADRPRVKIIDFGLARSLRGDSAGDLTMLTRPGQLLGTPAYMSPEQARGDVAGVDTRSDVYAIGVMLYQALTGTLPFQLEGEVSSAAIESLHRLQMEDPAKPSARVASTVQAASTTDRRTWSRSLRGDLDAIVLKALAYEPERRYESAGALQRDLERYLRHQPVLAQVPSRAYRARKLLRRYRVQFAAVGLVLATAIVGAIVALLFAFEARDQQRTAEDNLARWTRLADRRRLARLIDEGQALWPAEPKMAEHFRGWLGRAERLLERLDEHRAALAELRALGVDDPEASAAADREHYADQYLRLRAIEVLLPTAAEGEGPGLEAERASLEAVVARRHSWLFESDDLAFRHTQLSALVGDLELFARAEAVKDTVTVGDVRSRLATAEQLDAAAREPAFLAAWERLVADVARPDSVYAGLAIAPIPGLVPLGIDRDSGFWELYHELSGAPPPWEGTPLGRGAVQLGDHGDEGLVLVLLPGGTFRMGAELPHDLHPMGTPNVDPRALIWEVPPHEVELAPFLFGKFEVSQAQMRRLMPGADRSYDKRSPRKPVTEISWFDAASVAQRWGLRLPTEAQWEYACRADTSTVFCPGNDAVDLNGFANIADEGSKESFSGMLVPTAGVFDGHRWSAPVGSFRPNPFGLHDLHGNVQEWCRDELWYYERLAARAGDGLRGLSDGPPQRKVVARGGSYREPDFVARSSARVAVPADLRTQIIGIRVSREIR